MSEERNIQTAEGVPDDLPGIRGWLQRFRADFDAHDHSGSNSKGFKTLKAETVSSRVKSVRKSSYTDDTSGLWAGLVGNTMKMFLGTASAYMKWTGAALQIAGDLVAGSISIGSNASVDSSGNATFISMSSLNKKAYTNFETAARFISTLVGTGTNTFGNQGVTVAPGATGTGSARLLWDISHVFKGRPTLTATIIFLTNGTLDGRGFIGLGLPSIDGSGITYASKQFIGWRISKSSGVVTLATGSNDGNADGGVGTNVVVGVVEGDVYELYIKVAPSEVKWYYRINGGAMTLADTQTTRVPTGNEQYVFAGVTNSDTASDFKIILQSAGYEH